MKRQQAAGRPQRQTPLRPIHGEQVTLEGEAFYRIANYDTMRPFFMSIVSDADHWMFISSNGALTAGRRNPDLALFPYYTDDKIHDSAEITGSKTLLAVQRQGKRFLWQTFSECDRGLYNIRRNIFKNFLGNKIIFEEINETLALTFRYGWFNSDRFGFVRHAWLTNSGSPTNVSLLDGLQNLMPCGIGSQFQLEKSTLIDAYKKSELLPDSGLGLITLSSIPIDRPEPAEALKATTVWSIGLKRKFTLLSSRQLNAFRDGRQIKTEIDVRAERGAYFVQSDLHLRAGQTSNWLIVADVNRGPSDIAEINQLLRSPLRLHKLVQSDIARGSTELERIVANADGLQKSARPLGDARHFANVMFNVMRGGIPENEFLVRAADLRAFVQQASKQTAARNNAFFKKLKAQENYSRIVELAAATGDAQLERLCREYLPFTFSRRHGDPSRPWNRFSIATRNADGTRTLNYEGNWRDIFQNWEALAVSFPAFVPGMICRFANASTADGYNAYRITRDGLDWEVIEPDNPWSHIGYWGDHQIIYLVKLLEILQRQEPETLRGFLTRKIFAYANVPYRINTYEQLLADSKETVVFDANVEKLVGQRVKTKGADGKLVWDSKGNVRLVNFTEKLLVPLLAKFSNFIPEAGIWLNTQRPEWNDANNALVGSGVSMVTLYYMRRHLTFCRELFASSTDAEFSLTANVAKFLRSVVQVLEKHRPLLKRKISDSDRKRVLDALGKTGSDYRQQLYKQGLSNEERSIKHEQLLEFFDVALDWINHSIRANRRSDGLYHAYNLVSFDDSKRLPIRRLYEMLEGQVAVLSSGALSPEESLAVLTALRHSKMYRADQYSYTLYPDRQLPRFTEKNNIPPVELRRSALLKELVADGNRQLVERDVAGRFHFNGAIMNVGDVKRILSQLSSNGYERLVKKDSAMVVGLFEHLFDHQSFTGRSGTFFGYEGLGCIYWHMVSKLLLAAQESYFRASQAGAPKSVLKQLAERYHDIRAGIGDRKTSENYGAFPTDPYSHTPGHAGARQPGLTGQVKEDVLCRVGELGVSIVDGRIQFSPSLLRREEFLRAPADFHYYDFAGAKRRIRLPADSLAFTFCQTPVIYRIGRERALEIHFSDGLKVQSLESSLGQKDSRSVFDRTGVVERIVVSVRV